MENQTNWRELCEELLEALDGWHQAVFETGVGWVRPDETYLLDRARATLAQPEPEVVGPMQLPEQSPDEHPPSNLDRREVAAWYHGHGCGWQAARAVLARYGRPAPVPVAVSERLPGPEDCDAEGRCWVYQLHEACPECPSWELRRAKYASSIYGAVSWLPAHALPLPSGEPQP